VQVFCETKRGCDAVTRQLRTDGWPALSIHGDKSQQERDWVLAVRARGLIWQLWQFMHLLGVLANVIHRRPLARLPAKPLLCLITAPKFWPRRRQHASFRPSAPVLLSLLLPLGWDVGRQTLALSLSCNTPETLWLRGCAGVQGRQEPHHAGHRRRCAGSWCAAPLPHI
jgi:hypothetical protein